MIWVRERFLVFRCRCSLSKSSLAGQGREELNRTVIAQLGVRLYSEIVSENRPDSGGHLESTAGLASLRQADLVQSANFLALFGKGQFPNRFP